MTTPRVGQYGLVQNTGTISGFLIGLFTESPFVHVVTYIGSGTIVEATPRKGVATADINKYSNVAWNIHEPLTDEQGLAIAQALESFIGQKYLFRAIIADAFKILHLGHLIRFLGNLDEVHASDCSELLVKARRMAGVPIEGHMPDFLVKPSDLAVRLLYI